MSVSTQTGENINRILRRDWKIIFFIAVVFSFFFNLLRLAGPLFIFLVYDRILVSKSTQELAELFLLTAFLILVMGTMDYSRRRILARLGAQVQERFEEYLFSTTARGKFFSPALRKPVAGLNEIDNLRGFFHSNTLIAVLDFMWAPMFLAVVFYFHWMLGSAVVCGLLGLLALSLVNTSLGNDKKNHSNAARDKISSMKEMILVSREVIKSQEMSSGIKARWLHARQSSRDKSIEFSDWTSWFTIFARQIRMLLQYSVLGIGAYLVLNGELSVGAMVASMFLSVRVFVPVGQFIKELPAIGRALTSWKSLKRITAKRKVIVEKEPTEQPGKKLILRGVSAKSQLTGVTLLKSIDLAVEPGTIVEITGESCSGKTVLAETILGIFPKTSGKVLYGGTSVFNLSLSQAESMFGYVPESPALIRGSIEENISSLAVCPDSEKVFAAANLAQIHEMIMSLPDGYQTKVDPRNNCFSRGQNYQLALARALYSEPAILIIDEPDIFLRENPGRDLNRILRKAGGPDSMAIILSRGRMLSLEPDSRYILHKGRLTPSIDDESVMNLRTREL